MLITNGLIFCLVVISAAKGGFAEVKVEKRCVPFIDLLCPDPTFSGGKPVTQKPGTGQSKTCEDKLPTCQDVDINMCRKPHLEWAKMNCEKRCGLCKTDVTSGGGGNKGGTSQTGTGQSCTDRLPNCHDYSVEKCRGSNMLWAKKNCERRCGLCNINVKTSVKSTSKPIYTQPPITGGRNSCNDKLSNCHEYTVEYCRKPNLVWAKKNCELRCGLCNTIVKPDVKTTRKPFITLPPVTAGRNSCTDRLSNCHEYTVEYCKIPNLLWAKKNCERRCGLCNVVVKPKVTPNPPPVKKGCIDRGITRSFGDRWMEKGKFGETLTCICFSSGNLECKAAKPVTKPPVVKKTGCNDMGIIVPYGHRWIDIRSEWTQYICTCRNSGVIDCQHYTGRGACQDNNKYCQAWAKNGECRINPRYMLLQCRRSCKHC